MTASPIFEDQEADIDLVDNITPSDVDQLVRCCHFLLYFFLHQLLLFQMLLLGLILLLHLLHPLGIELVKIGQILKMIHLFGRQLTQRLPSVLLLFLLLLFLLLLLLLANVLSIEQLNQVIKVIQLHFKF